MIKSATIDGKKATVAYLMADFTPAASEEDAELVEVHFEDGSVVFGTIPKKTRD